MRISIFMVSLFLSASVSASVKEEGPTRALDYAKSDASLIQSLVERGSNVSKNHYVSFIIDCKTEQQVNSIVEKAKLAGFEDDYVSYSERSQMWSSTLSKELKLNVKEIASSRAVLIPFVVLPDCNPIGWGSSVEM